MKTFVAGARDSRLSQVQFQEVQDLLKVHHPHVTLVPHFVKTIGDIDQQTSLRNLGNTDFFTREIDDMLLKGDCRIAIHSAKDLPSPLPKGIALVALTVGVDPADSLVLRQGESFDALPAGSVIATSSVRREATVAAIRPDFRFIDLRGTIEKRLEKLQSGGADGVVVAEAALIRLGLTHLNRIRLPGNTTEGQGRLAILAREGDLEMAHLFSCLHGPQKP